MGSWWPKATIAVLAAFVVGQVDLASARPRNAHVQRSSDRGVPNIMVDVDASGTPIIMQGMPARRKASAPEYRATKHAGHPRRIPRGSSAYVAPMPLPRTAPIVNAPVVAPYIPPPLNTFSDRVTSCLQSFELNAGLGNNPSEHDFYVRSCANR
jgi:hypothetical protein